MANYPYYDIISADIEIFKEKINCLFECSKDRRIYGDCMAYISNTVRNERIGYMRNRPNHLLQKIEFLLQNRVNPDIFIDKDITLLDTVLKMIAGGYYYKREENIKLAILLLKYGSNVHINTIGIFSRASENRDLFKELEFYLIKKGVEIDISDHLYIGNKEKVLNYILEGGIISKNLLSAIFAIDDNEFLKLCLPKIKAENLYDYMQKNIVEDRSIEQLELLCNAHEKKEDLIRLLNILASRGDSPKVDLILSKKPNILLDGTHILMTIADWGNLSMLKKIINCGAYDKDEVFNARDKSENTLLIRHIIRSSEYPEFVEYVLSMYEDVDAMNKKGHTALMAAVKLNRKSTKIIEILVNYGADPYKRSEKSLSAIEYAKKYKNNKKTIEVLEQVNGGAHVKAAIST